MRTLTVLLLLAGLAMAIPLRKGATLGYKVWRGWESDSTYATLTVLDSTKTDSETLWRVGIRDSLVGGKRIRLDTATLRVRGDTDTVWQTPSCLVAWDPAPRRTATEIFEYASGPGTITQLAYGELAGACFPHWGGRAVATDSSGWQLPFSLTYSARGNLRTFWDVGLGEVFWFSVPQTGWIVDTGWGILSDSVSREDWKLLAVDGRMVNAPRPWNTTATLLTEMHPGESWTWEVTRGNSILGSRPFSTTSQVHWTVASAPADSAGWVRRTILSDTSMDLRFNPGTGQVVLSRQDNLSLWLADGMFRLWSDLALPENEWTRIRYSGEGDAMLEATGGSYDSVVEISRAGTGTDELVQGIFHNDVQGKSWAGSVHALLLIHDSDTVRTSSLSSGRALMGHLSLTSLSALREALSAHPRSAIHLTDLSGRTGIYSAREAMSALQARHGVILAELRDGAIRSQGRLFLP